MPQSPLRATDDMSSLAKHSLPVVSAPSESTTPFRPLMYKCSNGAEQQAGDMSLLDMLSQNQVDVSDNSGVPSTDDDHPEETGKSSHDVESTSSSIKIAKPVVPQVAVKKSKVDPTVVKAIVAKKEKEKKTKTKKSAPPTPKPITVAVKVEKSVEKPVAEKSVAEKPIEKGVVEKPMERSTMEKPAPEAAVGTGVDMESVKKLVSVSEENERQIEQNGAVMIKQLSEMMNSVMNVQMAVEKSMEVAADAGTHN